MHYFKRTFCFFISVVTTGYSSGFFHTSFGDIAFPLWLDLFGYMWTKQSHSDTKENNRRSPWRGGLSSVLFKSWNRLFALKTQLDQIALMSSARQPEPKDWLSIWMMCPRTAVFIHHNLIEGSFLLSFTHSGFYKLHCCCVWCPTGLVQRWGSLHQVNTWLIFSFLLLWQQSSTFILITAPLSKVDGI